MSLVFESAPEAEREALYRRFADEVATPLAMEHRRPDQRQDTAGLAP